MKFTLIFVTLSTFALSKARLPGPLKVCEDEVSGFECPDGQKPFPYAGEQCSSVSSGADIPRRSELKGMNPCEDAAEVKMTKISIFTWNYTRKIDFATSFLALQFLKCGNYWGKRRELILLL